MQRDPPPTSNGADKGFTLSSTATCDCMNDPIDTAQAKVLDFQSHSIAIAQLSGKGRGVVAFRDFPKDSLVERSAVIAIPRDDVPLIRQTGLANYYFEWGDDCDQAAIALGYGSLYNHSYTPNARYVFRESEECIEFIALRDIEAGEEITINYNNLEESAANPLSFVVK